MEPLQRKNVLCCLLFILSLTLTQRVLTLQEMHRHFIVYEYLATKQKNRRHLLNWKSMVQAVCKDKIPNKIVSLTICIGFSFFFMFTYKKDCSMESSNCEAYLQPSILIFFFGLIFSSRQNVYLSWHRSTWLSVGFPFPIGQVRSQVWCWPYLAAYFGFFELRTFPWSLSKVQVGRFYPFTLK